MAFPRRPSKLVTIRRSRERFWGPAGRVASTKQPKHDAYRQRSLTVVCNNGERVFAAPAAFSAVVVRKRSTKPTCSGDESVANLNRLASYAALWPRRRRTWSPSAMDRVRESASAAAVVARKARPVPVRTRCPGTGLTVAGRRRSRTLVASVFAEPQIAEEVNVKTSSSATETFAQVRHPSVVAATNGRCLAAPVSAARFSK